VFLGLLVHFHDLTARSFPGGKLINGADEPLEVHHIFPRALLDRFSGRDNEYVPDRLGNLTILTRSDNEHLSDTPPAEYLQQVDSDTRKAHLIPEPPTGRTVDKYKEFCEAREKLLAATMHEVLVGLGLS
jgi:hypothetical protein